MKEINYRGHKLIIFRNTSEFLKPFFRSFEYNDILFEELLKKMENLESITMSEALDDINEGIDYYFKFKDGKIINISARYRLDLYEHYDELTIRYPSEYFKIKENKIKAEFYFFFYINQSTKKITSIYLVPVREVKKWIDTHDKFNIIANHDDAKTRFIPIPLKQLNAKKVCQN